MTGRDERFFAACTNLPYPETRDERGEDSVPELRRLSEYVDSGHLDEAISYGRGLIRHYPDNDRPATVTASLLIRQYRGPEVNDLLLVTLPSVLRRYYLYSLGGQAELGQGHLANAAVWWSRSVLAQCLVIDYQAYQPFLNLGHVALVLGTFGDAEALFAMASAIEPRAPHISPELEEQLEPLNSQWVAEPLRQAIHYIQANHLHGVT